jgi:hypothetical protein
MAKTRITTTRRISMSRAAAPRSAHPPRSKRGHKLNALPDTLDFRDRMYVPTLIEVPIRIDLATYRKFKVPVLDQGKEGACTGFGLATAGSCRIARA